MAKEAKIVLFYGMGGAAIEWWNTGERAFAPRLEAIGAKVLLVNWNARQVAYDFMHGFEGFRAYAGDSLGAGSAAQFPGDVDGPVDFAGGFQPSVYDARAHGGRIEVAKNVVRAHCIYDPVWSDTLGLGNAQYIHAPGAKTKLLITQHRGAHPDDWGYSQDLIFNEIKGLIGA